MTEKFDPKKWWHFCGGEEGEIRDGMKFDGGMWGKVCECNRDLDGGCDTPCTELAAVPVVFFVYDHPVRVQWVCEAHYKMLVEIGLARDATNDEINESEGEYVVHEPGMTMQDIKAARDKFRKGHGK
jgi:hypothetical protein